VPHDDLATKFALLLVGGNGCVLSREPMLRSRCFAASRSRR